VPPTACIRSAKILLIARTLLLVTSDDFLPNKNPAHELS
jgi:hypothetical protein